MRITIFAIASLLCLTAWAEDDAARETAHLKASAAAMAKNDFAAAEASARAALAIRVTESAQLALMMPLVRLDKRTKAQQADLDENVAYFEKRTCTRADLCAGLAYVAWHLERHALTIRASERAISLGFKGWQPYLFGGSALAIRGPADREKAKEWLQEAKRRGAPPSVDGLLESLAASR